MTQLFVSLYNQVFKRAKVIVMHIEIIVRQVVRSKGNSSHFGEKLVKKRVQAGRDFTRQLDIKRYLKEIHKYLKIE